MELDDLTIRLRPRTGWAASDLGLTMMQQWWRPAYGVWFALTLPIFVLAHVIAGWSPFALLIFWWLKPLYERALLFVYSRAVFGSAPKVRDTLRQTPKLARHTGLLWHLTLGRLFSWTRAYLLPAYLLEGQTGKARRARLEVLAARDTGIAVTQFLIYSTLELIIASSGLVFILLLLPESVELTEYTIHDHPQMALFGVNLLVYIGISVVQPAFVASGFALYLNRRTILEGWDLELNLRRLAKRVATLPMNAIAAAALLTSAIVSTDSLAQHSFAQPTQPGVFTPKANAQMVIQEVLANPDFGREEQVPSQQWREVCSMEPDETADTDADWLIELWETMASAMRLLLWLVVIALAIFVVYQLAIRGSNWQNLWRDFAGTTQRVSAPQYVGGLSIAPETLPDDIASAARHAWSNGDPRAALSLLYRGAIVALVQRGMRLPHSSTEGNVLERASAHLSPAAMTALRSLIQAWQTMAYGHRAPGQTVFHTLLEDFEQHWAKQRSS